MKIPYVNLSLQWQNEKKQLLKLIDKSLLEESWVGGKSIQTFEKNGAILLKGVFKEWVPKIIAGIERNLSSPSKYANENNVDSGRFFDDY